ncbi:hypothetical protein ACHAXN_005724 [Cyclotella atomus]
MAEPTESSPDEYDVIICGTDLIQSILSSALSRAGKKVLHCDGNEWYGGFDAVLYTGSTLDCFIEGCQDAAAAAAVRKSVSGFNQDYTESDADDGELELLPREKYADLRLHSQTFLPCDEQHTVHLPPAKESHELFENKEVESARVKEDIDLLADAPEQSTTTQHKVDSDQCILDGNFSLDISPDLIYASGDAVQGLVKSGVADYLEFKSLKGLHLLMGKDDTKKQRHTTRGSKNTESNESTSTSADDTLISYRVPCSKGDVFRSQLLSPVDKRRLMKFLQLISDYGLAQDEAGSNNDAETVDEETAPADDTLQTKEHPETVAAESASEDAMYSINERYLNKGRSLSRPQNKAKPSTSELDSLIRCIRDNVDFSDYLINVAKLPPRLCSVVIHALALAPFGRSQLDHAYTTMNGVNDLLRHVSALGRFGDTAFLIPMYGSGELSQAFCRSGAVYGSTYMLRRAPLSISLTVDGDGNSTVKSVTLSGEEHIGGFADVHTDDTSKKDVGCSHVIVPSTMLPRKLLTRTSTRLRIYRRISILKGSLMSQKDNQDSEDTEQRYAVVIPPETPGLNNASAVHGIILDDSAFVAPARKGYTVLHLTTSVLESGESSDDACLDILFKSAQLVLDSQCSNEDRAKECHHISFSYSIDIVKPSDAQPIASGLHICYRDTQSITCDYAFREAKRIFEQICPEADFLALAKKVEDSIVYKNNDDSDDERMVLSNALDMIQDGVGGVVKPVETVADDVVGSVQGELANAMLDESISAEEENIVEVQKTDKIVE